jgi:hypothetical protein
MSTRNEVDMTDSIFLGSVAGGSQPQHTTATGFQSLPSAESDVVASKAQSNPVDDMYVKHAEPRMLIVNHFTRFLINATLPIGDSLRFVFISV